MRGKLLGNVAINDWMRITPAHAGKTSMSKNFQEISEDHPRACGENSAAPDAKTRSEGSPPRMRGKLTLAGAIHTAERITPAHAGKTEGYYAANSRRKDHPRACGENPEKAPA